jgi:hypothetical protein
LSIAAAFIVATGAVFVPRVADFFALTEDRCFLLAAFALGFLAALRLPLEGLLTRFFETLLAGFFDALVRPFFFFVAILTCSLFVGRA